MNRRLPLLFSLLAALARLSVACGPSGTPADVQNADSERTAAARQMRAESADADVDADAPPEVTAPSWEEVATRDALSGAAWREIDALQKKKRLQEALLRSRALRERAIQAGNQREWALALAREVRLRASLEGPESALDHLVSTPWPEAQLWQAALQLAKAQVLVELAREIPGDGRGAALPGDLQEEIDAAFGAVWQQRAAIAALAPDRLDALIERGTLADGFQPVPREAIAYLWAEVLADRALWKPAQRDRADRLALSELLQPEAPSALPGADAHPLVKLSSVLGDTERWNLVRGARAAALEAARTRFEALDRGLRSPRLRAELRAHFEKRFGEFHDVPGFALAMHALARAALDDPSEDALIEARRLALAGWDAFPEKPGGRLCDALVEEIERPRISIQAMGVAGPAQPSIAVTHAGAEALFFRAYALDARARFLDPHSSDFAPAAQEIGALIAAADPVSSWRVALEKGADFRPRQTLVTPPLEQPGAYFLVASLREDFAAESQLLAAPFFISSVLFALREIGRDLSALVLDARDGHPLRGAEVELFALDRKRGGRKVPMARARTNARGEALFRLSPKREAFGAIARRGEETAYAFLPGARTRIAREARAALRAHLILERSAGQAGGQVGWKAIAWHEDAAGRRSAVKPGTRLALELVDADGALRARDQLALQGLGTASGTLAIPEGARPGQWRVRLAEAEAGADGVGPLAQAPLWIAAGSADALDVALLSIARRPRLGHKAEFAIEARTAEGVPPAAGTGRWRLFRISERTPATSELTAAADVAPAEPELIGAGQGALDAAGRLTFGVTPTAARCEAQLCGRQRYRLEVEVADASGGRAAAAQALALSRPDVELDLAGPPGFLLEGVAAELSLARRLADGTASPGESRFWVARLDGPQAVAALGVGHGQGLRSAIPGSDVERAPLPQALLAALPEGERVASGTLAHGTSGLAAIALPALQAGAYRLHAETRDAWGEKCDLAREFIVASKAPSLPLPAVLLADSARAAVGQRVLLFAHSGRARQKMLLEIFRGLRRISQRWLTAQDTAAIIELPIQAADRGGLSARLTVAFDWQLLTLAQAIDVPAADQPLAIEVEPVAAAADAPLLPARALRLSIRRADGRPARAERVDVAIAIGDAPPPSAGAALVRAAEADHLVPSAPRPSMASSQQQAVRFAALRDDRVLAAASQSPPQTAALARFRHPRSARPAAAHPHGAPMPAGAKSLLWRAAIPLDRDGSFLLELPDGAEAMSLWVQALTRDLSAATLEVPLASLLEPQRGQ